MKKIDKSEINVLWINSWWDGPLEFICEHQGKVCYGNMTKEYKNGRRKYCVYSLTEKQVQDEKYWHELFITHVNGGYDYTGNAKPGVRPQAEWDKFYKPHKESGYKIDVTGIEPIGFTFL